LLREVYRRNQHSLRAPLDLILVARPAIAGMRLAEVEREYLTALRRHVLLNERA
jgi:ribonuclease P protein component